MFGNITTKTASPRQGWTFWRISFQALGQHHLFYSVLHTFSYTHFPVEETCALLSG